MADADDRTSPELVLYGGRITTLDPRRPQATALAVRDGRVAAVGDDAALLAGAGPGTRRVPLEGRRVVPGLNDSHTHLIRGGLHYNMELRWDGVPSLADALALLREQALRTPAPQWVRVVGGWSEFQFAERRMPTLEEINRAAPDTPAFVLHLYARALLNGAALRALGFTRDTPDPPGGVIERTRDGTPTGMLLARPSALILYSTLGRAPVLDHADQVNSTRHFMRELNRLGITSVIDAGGGGQSFPEDYRVVRELDERGELTVRIAYNLFAQKAGEELADFRRWVGQAKPGTGSDWLRANGAGENLVWSAADFENFLEPRPELAPKMEEELGRVVRLLVSNRWPFRVHATYDESIDRFLTLFEEVDREIPFDGLRFTIDHAETATPRSLDRIRALGGGVAVQHRMAYQGEYFVARYGARAAERTPPVRRMLEAGLPVGMGTDATRVASYNPWVGLHWLVTGKTVGGLALYPAHHRLDRHEALRLYTAGSAWFSGEEGEKGTLAPGMAADLCVLSDDYFAVPADEIPALQSVLTVVGGRVVHGAAGYEGLAPPLPPASPDWSPVARHRPRWQPVGGAPLVHACGGAHRHPSPAGWPGGCGCFAF